MKRDMNLIRHLLAYVEEQPAGSIVQQVTVPDGTDGPTVGEHIDLMIERRLIEGDVVDVNAPAFVIQRLTWEGHDFLQAVQNDTVWQKILGKAKDLGGSMTLEIAKELGKKYLMEIAGV
ncbi:MAG: DUF2513 domain-containing protein [Lentisphaerales bacterium]|nr:MAG: DUF2513 domain-containing protein [Lentisphaerales bacterium]